MINVSENKLGEIKYLLCTPKDFKSCEKYPVIIHFHGSGSRGDDVSVLKQQAIVSYAKENEEFPFIMFLPQCNSNSWFDIFEQLRDFVKTAVTHPNADESKVYLSGVSMGGYASWQMLMSEPEIFKKAVICCGGGMYWNAGRIKAEVWAFHGDVDTVVLCEESQKMVNAVNKNGGKAKLTQYKNVSHNCWDQTYSNPEIYKWLLSNGG